jgi:hypothetical protein
MPGRTWDPLLEAVTRRFEEDMLQVVQAQARPHKWRRRVSSVRFQLRHRWLDLVFVLATVIPLTMGVALLATSYPWSSTPATQDYAGLVATAATATAFGGVLFSLIAAPLQAASELAAGYSAELLHRRILWLTGAWLVALAIALFVFSALRPDREAAIASGLLTGSSIALVWTAARRLIASSDPQDAARRVAAFIAKGMNDSRNYMRVFVRTSLPKELRDEQPGLRLIRKEEQAIVNGFLRHFKAGVEGALAHRQPASALVLWDAALEAFVRYAKEVDGEIGESQGIAQTLLYITDEMVKQGLSIPVDDVAVYPIRSLERLFVLDLGGSYSLIRSACLTRLRNWIQAGWSDDNTAVPVVAIETGGKLLRESVRFKAHEDALHVLSALHEVAQQSVARQRTHIALAAIQEIVVAFSSFLGAEEEHLRSYLVERWCDDARPLSGLRIAESNVVFMRATDSVFPGISLWKRGLQEIIAQLAPYAHLSAHVVQPLAEWLDTSLRDFGSRKETPIHYFAVDGLALLYCLAITQAHAVAAGAAARPEQAKLVSDVVVRWSSWLSDDDVVDVLLDADVGEMMWSLLLATGYTAGSPDLLRENAQSILQRLDGRLEGRRPPHFTLSLEFITGVLAAAGRPEEEIDAVWTNMRKTDPWSGSDRGMYIEGLGRVPAVNRNRVAVADPRVFDTINEWAVQTFPGFAQRPDAASS